MGLTRFTIYKYCRTANGWRYCRAAYAPNRRIKPDVVMVAGKEQAHAEGAYYLNVDGHWDKVGDSAAQAQEEQARRLARQRYEKETGEKVPEPENNGELLRDAIDAYIGELELKVANRSRRPKTLAASRLALNEFADQTSVKLLHGVTAKVIAAHMAWVIGNSRTKSARTAAKKFLLILQFLKHVGAVPMVGAGKSARPLGMKDAPRYTESEVETYTDDELRRFFAACGPREEAVFQTLDNEESALSRLKREIVATLENHERKVETFQTTVQAALEAMKAQRQEAARSTQHGNDFVDVAWEFMEKEARKSGDIPSRTGTTTGAVRNCKVGDLVIEHGAECAAAGARYVA